MLVARYGLNLPIRIYATPINNNKTDYMFYICPRVKQTAGGKECKKKLILKNSGKKTYCLSVLWAVVEFKPVTKSQDI